MEKISFYLKSILLFLGYLIVLSFLSSILYLYTAMAYNINCLILFIFTSIGFAVLNFFNGKKAANKGYLAGLKLGGSLLLAFFIISLLAKDGFSLSKLVYYGILLLISIITSSIGINVKDSSNLK